MNDQNKRSAAQRPRFVAALPMPPDMARPDGRDAVDDLIVAFDPGSKKLSLAEAELIRRWVARWLPQQADAMVVMGCDSADNRSARVDRLRAMRELMTGCGVAEERIRYTGDSIETPATLQAAEPEANVSAAHMKVIPAEVAAVSVQPIRAFFVADQKEEAACSNVS